VIGRRCTPFMSYAPITQTTNSDANQPFLQDI
jgi:hypothetical protein